jgi:hypothetical protein
MSPLAHDTLAPLSALASSVCSLSPYGRAHTVWPPSSHTPVTASTNPARKHGAHAFPVEVDLEIGQGERQSIAADFLDPGILARHDAATLGLLLAALL